jgi:hypothetical protein
MKRTLLIVVAMAGTAHADKLSMRYAGSENLHLAGGGGSSDASADIAVEVELQPDGKVAASASGTSKQHQLFAQRGGASWNTTETTVFALRWTGAWKRDAGKLVLDLALALETCTRTKLRDGEPPKALPCRTASKKAALTCATTHVVLDGAAKAKVAAWTCAPALPHDLGESPAWTLGKSQCLKIYDGKTGRAIDRC